MDARKNARDAANAKKQHFNAPHFVTVEDNAVTNFFIFNIIMNKTIILDSMLSLQHISI